MKINIEEIKNNILNELSQITRPGIAALKDYLLNSDFFESPCSATFHLNIPGGLALHSWQVYNILKEKNKRYNLKLKFETLIITGLLHDLCKINFYKKTAKGYSYTNNFPCGHGEKSVFRILNYIKLSEQEMCMIRWHMNKYDISNYNEKDYYSAIKQYPACLALYTADHESTVFLEE